MKLNTMYDSPRFTVEEITWLEAWLTLAAAPNCFTAEIATLWADKCVKDFHERFRADYDSETKI